LTCCFDDFPCGVDPPGFAVRPDHAHIEQILTAELRGNRRRFEVVGVNAFLPASPESLFQAKARNLEASRIDVERVSPIVGLEHSHWHLFAKRVESLLRE